MQLPAGTNLCPDCGYSLEGHTAPTRCPECGCTDVGDDVIIVWGERLQESGGQLNMQGASVGLGALLAIGGVLVVLGIFGLIVNRGVPPVAIFCLVAGVLLPLLRLFRGGGRRSKRWQLRLTPRGFGQRRGPGKTRVQRWLRTESIIVLHSTPDVLAVRIAGPLYTRGVITRGTADDAAHVIRTASAWSAAGTGIESQRDWPWPLDE